MHKELALRPHATIPTLDFHDTVRYTFPSHTKRYA
jgi:hypothetical protein